MNRKHRIKLGNKGNHILGGAPIEIVATMHINLFATEPFHAVGNSPRALPGKESCKLHAQSRVSLSALRQTIVVVGFCEMDQCAIFFGASHGRRQIPFELGAVVSLEYFRIRPIKSGFAQQLIGNGQIAAKPLKHKNRIWIFLADFGYNIIPDILGNHVPGITSKTINSEPTPE